MNTIKAIDFINNINNPEYKIIDIREKNEFMLSHISGSINIPYNTLKKNYQMLLSKGIKYFIICSKGITSLEVTSFLNIKGYNTTSVTGGFNAYILLASRIQFHNYY